ncbi:hypothetical protein Patl1_07982 [Pistacia atlantica]|uniref:Uncharacterized protein n=1 Tax=Pistacia atlantica TaxID=434234 RepID=A0ACC1AK41_9ROSI|nr:hypothetical protein Patl1_07982 [Pistacia atlantica]
MKSMDPSTLSMNASSSQTNPPDGLVLKNKLWSSRDESNMSFASVRIGDNKPFDYLRVLLDCAIAGGTAGVIVEAALYPIDTIKTRLQAAHYGGQIGLKGLYSGLLGNLAGVLPASAIFVGVYEPVKQKLLKTFPQNLSAFAHLVSVLSKALLLLNYNWQT